MVTFLLKKRARRSEPVLLHVLGFTVGMKHGQRDSNRTAAGSKTLLGRNKGKGLTLLHAAHVTKLGLVLAILASAGARLESVLLTDGTGAALRGRGTKTGRFTC